jgi:hypothetical protein
LVPHWGYSIWRSTDERTKNLEGIKREDSCLYLSLETKSFIERVYGYPIERGSINSGSISSVCVNLIQIVRSIGESIVIGVDRMRFLEPSSMIGGKNTGKIYSVPQREDRHPSSPPTNGSVITIVFDTSTWSWSTLTNIQTREHMNYP